MRNNDLSAARRRVADSGAPSLAELIIKFKLKPTMLKPLIIKTTTEKKLQKPTWNDVYAQSFVAPWFIHPILWFIRWEEVYAPDSFPSEITNSRGEGLYRYKTWSGANFLLSPSPSPGFPDY